MRPARRESARVLPQGWGILQPSEIFARGVQPSSARAASRMMLAFLILWNKGGTSLASRPPRPAELETMIMIKVRNWWVGIWMAALTLGEVLAASPRGADDSVDAHALPIGLGVLLLAATVFRRRRGRN